MSSLKQVYWDAVVDKYGLPKGWVTNWPPGMDREPGDVGVVDPGEHSFNKDGVLADYGITAARAPGDPRPDGEWQYTSSSNIKVEIGVDASLPDWTFIGNAKAGLKVGFGQSAGLVVAVGSAHQEELGNIDALKSEMVKAAKEGRMPLGKSVIVQQVVGDTGLVITSEGDNAELAATTNFDVGPAGTPTLASFAADFNLAHKSQSVAENSYPNGFTIGFRAVTLGKRGWFWWRHVVAMGVRPLSDDDLEALIPEEDYWAPIPEFSPVG